MPRPKSNLAETVFVRYIPPNPAVTHGLLTTTFSEYGPVKKCSVIRDQKHGDDNDNGGKGGREDDAKRTRGYGFVRFSSAEDAAEAVSKLHGTYLSVGEYGDRVKLFVERASDAAISSGKDKKGAGSKPDQEEPVARADDGGGEDD